MTPKQLARAVAAEKNAMLREYFAKRSQTSVAQRINELDLTPAHRRRLRRILDEAMTDLCYTLLLALDGEASLGGIQQSFTVTDEDGNILTNGELEAAAYEVFHRANE